MELTLPAEMIDGAILRADEYAWDLSAFPRVLEIAPRFGCACLGGEVWFMLPDDVLYEPFWLQANFSDQRGDESWPEFAHRSCQGLLSKFNTLVSNTDFIAEARKFRALRSVSDEELKSTTRMLFSAHFFRERDYEALKGFNQSQSSAPAPPPHS